MQFLDIFNQSWDILRESISELNSLRSSSQSDIPHEVWISGESLKNSSDALAVLGILPLVYDSRSYFQIFQLREHISRMASNYRYQGDWYLVGEILSKTTSEEVYSTWTILFDNFNEHDWFGNFVPKLLQAVKSVQYRRSYTGVTEDPRPVKRTQRKRGYDDKGSQRLSHLWLPSEYPSIEQKKLQKRIKEPIPLFWFWRYRGRSG